MIASSDVLPGLDIVQCEAFVNATAELEWSPPERTALRRIALDTERFSAAEAFWLILRWGGIHAGNAKTLSANCKMEVDVFDRIRKGELDKDSAFEEFNRIPSNGLGPSFFTKLIFFGSKDENRGYIMDQWVSKSINRLFPQERPIVLMNGRFPSRANRKLDYSQFCRCIDLKYPF